jgi:hypothetical protein
MAVSFYVLFATRSSLRYFDDMRFKSQTSHIMAVAVDDAEMITVALPLMEKMDDSASKLV